MTPESLLLMAWLDEAEAPQWVVDGVADSLPKIEAGAREAFRAMHPIAAARQPWTAEPETVARMFHETYERLASDFGYETRRESAVPWEDVPERNRSLMVATVVALTAALRERAR